MSTPVAPSVRATAYTAAACRAAETRRPRPRLTDPLAELFTAGGAAAPVQRLADAGLDEVVGRTLLIDDMLTAALHRWPGAAVLNLGAGFCTRPYRLALPGCREVVEADDPAVIAVKDRTLADRRPACPVRRVALDARDATAVTALIDGLGRAGAVVVVTEGLLVYLPQERVTALAAVLAGRAAAVHWLADVVTTGSAAQMRTLALRVPGGLDLHGLESLAPLEGPGWRAVGYRPLPTPRIRRGPVPAGASRALVDGVVALDRSAGDSD